MGDEPKDEGGFDWDKLCEGVAPTLDVETLAGDLRDSYLQRFKSKKVPWQHLTEQEQNAEITEGREWAMKLVRQVVHAVARRGFATIPVAIKKWQVKDGIQAQVDAVGSEDNSIMLARHGDHAMLVLASPSEFAGEKSKPLPDKDQPDLPMGGNPNEPRDPPRGPDFLAPD